jgi:hypothetical protein
MAGYPTLCTLIPAARHARAAWEPTLVCLGHVFRKQRRWGEAVAAFEKALGLCPGQPGTHAALGYTHHLQARPGAAPPHAACSPSTQARPRCGQAARPEPARRRHPSRRARPQVARTRALPNT